MAEEKKGLSRLENLQETEENNKKVKKLYVGLIVFLCLVFVALFIWMIDSVMAMEGTEVPFTLTEAEREVPADMDSANALIADSIGTALEKNPRLTVSDRFGINGDSIDAGNDENIKIAAKYLCGNIENKLDDNYSDEISEYGDSNASLLHVFDFSGENCKEMTLDYIYYRCPSCGETDKEPHDSHEACGCEEPFVKQYNDNYVFRYAIFPDSALADEVFKKRSCEDIVGLLGDGLDGICDVTVCGTEITVCSAEVSINRLTEKISRIVFSKTENIDTAVAFTGDYAEAGNAGISCEVTEYVTYAFEWPALSLNTHELVLEPKGTENLTATLFCDSPVEYTSSVKWTSSDDSVVTVDDEGYMKACKHDGGEAEITASFEYQGVEYSDTCLVKVRIPVEKNRVSHRKLKLEAGESAALNSKVSPKDATVKTVSWSSSDESVATVDENGLVTAVAPGVAVIKSLSDDGFYKSTCEVTVYE